MKRLVVFPVLLFACGRPAESPKPEEKPAVAQPPASPSAKAPMPPPAASADEAADPPPAPSSPFAAPAMQKHPNDLAWLTELVRVLSDEPATREHVTDYLGKDAGADMAHLGGRLVHGHSPYFEAVAVYPIVAQHIDVAVDIKLKAGSLPAISAIESALGPLAMVPPQPGDKGGKKMSHQRKGKRGTARVVVELDAKQTTQIAAIHAELSPASE